MYIILGIFLFLAGMGFDTSTWKGRILSWIVGGFGVFFILLGTR